MIALLLLSQGKTQYTRLDHHFSPQFWGFCVTTISWISMSQLIKNIIQLTCLCSTHQWWTCCLLSYLKDAGSLSTNTCATAYSECLQLRRHLLSGAAHVDCILHTNANRKGQVQVFLFLSYIKHVSLEKQIDVLCVRDWLSEQKNKWETTRTLNTGGTCGSTRNFCYSNVVIQTLGLEHCAAN